MKESDIIHQSGNWWVMHKKGLFYVMESGTTHAVSETTAYRDKSLAIARANYMSRKHKGIRLSF